MLQTLLGLTCLIVAAYAGWMVREFWAWRRVDWQGMPQRSGTPVASQQFATGQGSLRAEITVPDDEPALDAALQTAWRLQATLHAVAGGVAMVLFAYCGVLLLMS